MGWTQARGHKVSNRIQACGEFKWEGCTSDVVHICTTNTTATYLSVKGGSRRKNLFRVSEMQGTAYIHCISPPFVPVKLLLSQLQQPSVWNRRIRFHSYSGRTSHIHTISFCYSLMSVYRIKRFLRAEIHYRVKADKRAQESAFLGGGSLIPYNIYIHWRAWWMEKWHPPGEKCWLICLFLCAQHRTRVACGRCE